jgi:hypothetical protein
MLLQVLCFKGLYVMEHELYRVMDMAQYSTLQFMKVFAMLLQVLSYKDLYGWSMDQIVSQIGTRNNCTFCGVFRWGTLHNVAPHCVCTPWLVNTQLIAGASH